LQNAWGTYKTAAMPDPLLSVGQTVFLMASDEEDEFTIPSISQNYFVAAYSVDDADTANGIPDIPTSILPYHRTDFDILVFTDNQHLDTISNYLDYLDSVFYYIDFEEIAAAFHDNFFGFYSYYHLYNDTYDDEHIFEDDEDLLDMHIEWFIDDEFLKVVFNSERMIGIGKKIYLWLDYHTVLSVYEYDTTGIEDLIHLSSNPDLLTIYLLKPNITLESSGPFTYTIEVSTRAYQYDAFANVYYRTLVTTTGATCNNYKKGLKITVHKSQSTQQTNNPDTLTYQIVDWNEFSSSSLSITWGDGASSHINSYTGQTIEHTYSQLDMTYYPVTALGLDLSTYSLSLYDGQGTSGVLITLVTNGLLCSQEEHREPYIKTSNDGKYKLLCEHWFESRFMNTSQIGARTSIYIKNQNGTGYKKHKGKITATVDGKLYEQTNCGGQKSKFGSKTRKNRHSLQKRKTWVFGASRSLQQQNQSRTVHRLAGLVEYEFWFVPC
jgi:hypothetical protein